MIALVSQTCDGAPTLRALYAYNTQSPFHWIDVAANSGQIATSGQSTVFKAAISLYGQGAITMQPSSITGTDAAVYAITADGCAGLVMLSGQICEITYTITALGTHQLSASLNVAGSGSASFANALKIDSLVFDLGPPPPPVERGQTLHTISPSRLLDTRDATGVPGTSPLGKGQIVTVPIAGRKGVPTYATGVIVSRFEPC